MDAFAFDKKFSRFLSRMDTEAIKVGVVLYETGSARANLVEAERIEGEVTDSRGNGHRTKLLVNDEGGFSGSCSCPEFFNCSHSYALARAARDVVHGKKRSASVAKPIPPPAQPKLPPEIAKLWQVASQSNGTLYPRDLQGILAPRTRLALPDREPLRELKRMLPEGGAKSAQELANAVRCFCEEKGIAVSESFSQQTDSNAPKARYATYQRARKPAAWEKAAVSGKRVWRVESTGDANWFELSSGVSVSDSSYTKDEISKLEAAAGDFVQLGEKGWQRLEVSESDAGGKGFALAMSGNSIRLHVSQLEAMAADGCALGSGWDAVKRRSRELASVPLAIPPETFRTILRPYQVEGFQFLSRLSSLGCGGILADDMGLGKTVQTLAWMVALRNGREDGGVFRALVVCPKSVTDNWIQETKKFGAGIDAVAYQSGMDLDRPGIVVANYAQLRIQEAAFRQKRWTVAIMDEGQYLKNADSQTSVAARKLDAAHRLVLTGTPIENRLGDLWSLFEYAMPGLLGERAAFERSYGYGSDPESVEALRRRVQPFMLRRKKSQVAKDLPERIEEEIRCELDDGQRTLYLTELARAREALKGGGGAHFNVLQSLLRMRQICCDPRLVGAGEASEGPSAKVLALVDLLEPLIAEGHKTLVFSQFVRMLEIIQEELTRRGIATLSLTGKTQNRKRVVDRFQSDEGEPVFLLSLKAAGSGLNLTAASYVVLFDPWWNPAVEAQAIDRAHRIGQTSQVIAYRILAKDTVEEKIRALQSRKRELADSVVSESELEDVLDLDTLRAILGE